MRPVAPVVASAVAVAASFALSFPGEARAGAERLDPAAARDIRVAQPGNAPAGTTPGARPGTPDAGTGTTVGTPSAPAEIVEKPVMPGNNATGGAASALKGSSAPTATSQDAMSRSKPHAASPKGQAKPSAPSSAPSGSSGTGGTGAPSGSSGPGASGSTAPSR